MKEIWKDINGYEGRYQVSNLGRVKSLARTDRNGHKRKDKILKPHARPNGYLCVHLSKDMDAKWLSIHRLVAEAFVAHRPDGYDIVNHIDNNPANNAADNLEWATYKTNMQWAAKQGRMKPHLENLAKAQATHLTPVIAISKTGERIYFSSQKEAGEKLGIASNHIGTACRKEYGYKTVGGYEWEYADEDRQKAQKPNKIGMTPDELAELKRQRMMGNKIMCGKHLKDETKKKLSDALSRPVTQYTKTGKKVADYASVKQALDSTGITHINDVANGKRKTAGGYVWKWRKKQDEECLYT